MVSNADGSAAQVIRQIEGTNHRCRRQAIARVVSRWDACRFISATPGPEADANGDPMVITRYLYKPTASEGRRAPTTTAPSHLRRRRGGEACASADGRRLLRTLDRLVAEGDEILFVSNRGPDPDRFFNYDVFAVNVCDRRVRRLTETKSAEYYPRWSPDGSLIAFSGTTRPLTSRKRR